MDACVAQQALEHLQRRMLVPAFLNQKVEDLAVVIDLPPQIHPPPPIFTTALSRCQRPVGLSRPDADWRRSEAKPDHPAPDRLTADLDSALGRQFLDVTDAELEPETPANRLQMIDPRNR